MQYDSRYCGKKRIEAGDKYKFLFEDEETYSIIISDVNEDDMNKWKIKAVNEEGDVSSSARLIITGMYRHLGM